MMFAVRKTAYRLLLCIAIAGVSACGGGGDKTGGTTPPPTEPELVKLEGELLAFVGAGSIQAKIGTNTYDGSIDSSGAYTLEIPPEDLIPGRVLRLEASGLGADGKGHLVSLVPDAGELATLAGDDSIVTTVDASELKLTELSTGIAASLFVENDNSFPLTTEDLERRRRDTLEGNVALTRGAAVRLIEGSHELPAAYSNVWELLTDRAGLVAFLDGVRTATTTASKSAAGKTSTDTNEVDSTVTEIAADAQQVAPFVQGQLPSDYYRMTSIVRSLDFPWGMYMFLLSDGTGELRIGGTSDSMKWTVTAGGVLEVVPDNGAKIRRLGKAPDYSETIVEEHHEAFRFTRVSQGVYADILSLETVSTLSYTDPAWASDDAYPLNYPFLVPLRSVVAVQPGGSIEWSEQEPVGTWMLPGSIANPYEQVAENFPVARPDLFTFNSDGTGTTMLTAQNFSWAFEADNSSERRGLKLTFDDGSTSTFYKLRHDGFAFDIANVSSKLSGATGAVVKTVGGSMSVKRDPAVVYDPVTIDGDYKLFSSGGVPLTSHGVQAFTMRLQNNQPEVTDNGQLAQTFTVLDDGSMHGDAVNRRWSVDSEGTLLVETRVRTSDGMADPNCNDAATCWAYHDRTDYPVARDGDRLYSLDVLETYEYDDTATSNWLRGNRYFYHVSIRYWDKEPIPTP